MAAFKDRLSMCMYISFPLPLRVGWDVGLVCISSSSLLFFLLFCSVSNHLFRMKVSLSTVT